MRMVRCLAGSKGPGKILHSHAWVVFVAQKRWPNRSSEVNWDVTSPSKRKHCPVHRRVCRSVLAPQRVCEGLQPPQGRH